MTPTCIQSMGGKAIPFRFFANRLLRQPLFIFTLLLFFLASTAAGSRLGRISTSDVRQFRSEARQRIQEALELERLLDEVDLNQQQLGDVIAALRQLDREDVYIDLAELSRLQSQIVEGVMQLEFSLRRELEGEGEDRIFISGSDDVPTGFEDLVEEYSRALARSSGN